MNKYLSLAIITGILTACGGSDDTKNDEVVKNSGGTISSPVALTQNGEYYFDGDESTNNFYFAARKGDLITVTSKPEKHPNSIYDNAIVICQNGMARSAIYTGISLTGKYQNQRRKSCSLSYTFEITEDDNYQLSIGYSVNGTANPGKFSFIKQSPSTPAPMFNEIKYAELNKKYLSNRFAITDSNGMFDIENGTIVLNGKDTQSKSQYVEFGDVVQVDLISPNTLNSSNETTANINNTSGSFIIETKPEDLSQLSSATYNVIGESKYYLTASNDEIDFTWQSSSYNTMKIYNLDSGALIYSDYGNSYGVKRVSLTGVKYSQVVMSINDEQGINIIGL